MDEQRVWEVYLVMLANKEWDSRIAYIDAVKACQDFDSFIREQRSLPEGKTKIYDPRDNKPYKW